MQQGEAQPFPEEEEEEEERAGIEHPVVEAEHTLLPWLSTLIQQRPSSSCSGVLPSEQAQPLPTTLQQGAALEPPAVADADADADADASDTFEEAFALIGRAPLALNIEVSIPLIKIRPKQPNKCQR